MNRGVIVSGVVVLLEREGGRNSNVLTKDALIDVSQQSYCVITYFIASCCGEGKIRS